jgi:hypothetical protein
MINHIILHISPRHCRNAQIIKGNTNEPVHLRVRVHEINKHSHPGMGAADSRSLRFDSYVRMQHFVRRSDYVPFRRFLGDMRREFMQRLSVALHGTMGSYLRDDFQEGTADAVACLPVPRA